MTREARTVGEELAAILTSACARAVTPGAVVQFAVDGNMSGPVAAGSLATTDDAGSAVPASEREAVDPDTVFDLASVTKMYSALTLLTLVEDRTLDLDSPVAEQLPNYRSGEKTQVTLRQLLTHTSGLPATWSGWRTALESGRFDVDDFTTSRARAALLENLLATPLEHPPGGTRTDGHWEYSCLGYNTAMVLAEQASGQPWQALVHTRVLEPLGLKRTTFAPDPSRTAATEWVPELYPAGPGRGVVRGIVHDESAWSLGGTCANAGLFAPVADVVRLGEFIRTAGDDTPLARAAARMWPEEVSASTPGQDLGQSHTLGLRIGQTVWMSAVGARARGHTGFTGTSLQMDAEHRLTIAILTNRVHPARARSNDPRNTMHALRREITTAIYEKG